MTESLTDEITALNQLAYRYAKAIDACDDVLLNQVFTPDGRMRVYHPGEEQPFIDLNGPEELASVPRTMAARALANHAPDDQPPGRDPGR